jgi:hypothetical protein
MSDVQKWREAYRGINLSDEALATAGPFPSLYVGDYLVFLERKGADEQTVAIVKAMHNELVFAYGGWAKAVTDGNTVDLLDRLSHSTDNAQVHKFLSDWRQANGYPRKTPAGVPDYRLPTVDEMSAVA